MPTIDRDGASIYYEEYGSGTPLLLLAPGALNSAIDFWHRMPLNPIEAFADEFRVIAMDQRNAGRSSGPLDTVDPWGMYARDQLAVLDHLGIDKVLLAGCCIGSSFIFKLIELAPERVIAAVPMQPIGRDETNQGAFGPETWQPWGQALIDKGTGFVFSVSRDFLRPIRTPLLLLYGNDRAHPRGVSVEAASLLPNVEQIERWRDPDVVADVTERMRNFLRSHELVGAA